MDIATPTDYKTQRRRGDRNEPPPQPMEMVSWREPGPEDAESGMMAADTHPPVSVV